MLSTLLEYIHSSEFRIENNIPKDGTTLFIKFQGGNYMKIYNRGDDEFYIYGSRVRGYEHANDRRELVAAYNSLSNRAKVTNWWFKDKLDSIRDKYKRFLNENTNLPKTTESGPEQITIDTIADAIQSGLKNKWKPTKHILNIVYDFYYDEKDPTLKESAENYINIINDVIRKTHEVALKLNIPYYDKKGVVSYLFSLDEYLRSSSEYFPMPIYIGATPEIYETIGIMVSESAKVLEIHEGNDEAPPETIALANKLLNPQGKQVRVYGAHDRRVVQNIDISETLPANIYVSPNREYASGYMDLKGEREMFTGVIDINDVNQESEVDWKTIDKTHIKNFRYL